MECFCGVLECTFEFIDAQTHNNNQLAELNNKTTQHNKMESDPYEELYEVTKKIAVDTKKFLDCVNVNNESDKAWYVLFIHYSFHSILFIK